MSEYILILKLYCITASLIRYTIPSWKLLSFKILKTLLLCLSCLKHYFHLSSHCCVVTFLFLLFYNFIIMYYGTALSSLLQVHRGLFLFKDLCLSVSSFSYLLISPPPKSYLRLVIYTCIYTYTYGESERASAIHS